MIVKVFAVFDAKARAFGMPFFAHNAAMAQRNVGMAMRDPSSILGQHAEDFQLFEVSEFDDATGMFAASAIPVVVCNLSTLRGDNG